MAIFHHCIRIVSRGKGKSAIAAAAYRAGEKIKNEYDGIIHDYTRKGGVVHTEILLPDWTSSDNSIATVSADGLVKAIAAGEATITVHTVNGLHAECLVTVPIELTVAYIDDMLELGYDMGVFSNNGAYQNISSSLKNAQKQLEKGNINQAVQQLQGAIDSFRKDAGKKIDADYADEMIMLLELLILKVRSV